MQQQRAYHILDVFTDRPLAGNPLAVVHESADLDGDAMQAIALEFNLSETVFVAPPKNPLHTARVRIFTPRHELPFAGHPTIGAAILLAGRMWEGTGTEEGIVVLEEEVGPVRVGVTLGAPAFAEFDSPALPKASNPAPEPELVADALGLMASEIGFENHRPTRWSVGTEFAFVPVRDLAVLGRCRPDPRAVEKVLGGAAYVYCRETLGHEHDFHARMFAPGMGLAEDPATGSAAAAFAGVVEMFDRPTGGTHSYVIEQGFMMDRPSLIRMELEMSGGVRAVRIGGSAVIVAEGTLWA